MPQSMATAWLFFIIALFGATNALAAPPFGQYLPTRVDNHVNYPDKEAFFDFDSATMPQAIATRSSLALSDKHYLTAPQSLAWETKRGGALELRFNALPIDISKWGHLFRIAILSEDPIPSDARPAFRIELLDGKNPVASTTLYLHRQGWNSYHDLLNADSWHTQSGRQAKVDGIRLICLKGQGTFYVENAGLTFGAKDTSPRQVNPDFTRKQLPTGYLSANGDDSAPETFDQIDPSAFPPADKLTAEEIRAFRTIETRIDKFYGVDGPAKLSDKQLQALRDRFAKLNIRRANGTINGQDLTEWIRAGRGNQPWKYRRNPNIAAHYEACQLVNDLGRAYAQTQDTKLKQELGSMVADIAELAIKLGTAPNSWYPGRGFVPGVYLTRNYLRQAGLADRIVEHVRRRYNTDIRLYTEQADGLRAIRADNHSLSWSNADYVNTSLRSTTLSILLQTDSPEKARDLRRISEHISQSLLSPAPGQYGTWKPDGAEYHHWGHRYDNYAQGAWLGATQAVYFLSRTPFQVAESTHRTLRENGRKRFFRLGPHGTVGPAHNQYTDVSADGYAYLAEAGKPGGRAFDPEMAAYAYAYGALTNRPPKLIERYAKKIPPANTPQGNQSLNYAGQMHHRRGDWLLNFHGTGQYHYYLQYVTPGLLFHSIGAMSLFTPEQQPHPSTLPGYHMRYTPGCTSMRAPMDKLDLPYYFRGVSPMLGGVSSPAGDGVFAIEFTGQRNGGGDKVPLGELKSNDFGFKKSFFCFDNTIVLLGAGITGDLNLPVDTALLQAPLTEDHNTLWVNGQPVHEDNYEQTWPKAPATFIVSPQQDVGVYVPQGQPLAIRKQEQTWLHKQPNSNRDLPNFKPAKGRYALATIEHGANPKQSEYQFITLIKPDQGETQRFAQRMASPQPPIQILLNTPKAQLVRHHDKKSVGLAAFTAVNRLPNESDIASVSGPCLVMTERPDAQRLVLSAANPDLNFSKNQFGRYWRSQPQPLTIRLRGAWQLDPSVNAEDLNMKVQRSGGNTVIQMTCQDGLTNQVTLIQAH